MKSLSVKYLLVSIVCLAMFACGDVDRDITTNEYSNDSIALTPAAPAISIISIPLIRDGDIDIDSEKINDNGAFRIFSVFPIQKPIDLVFQKFGDQLEEINTTVFLYGTRSVIFFLRDDSIQTESAYMIRGYVTNSAGIETPLSIRFFTKIKEGKEITIN